METAFASSTQQMTAMRFLARSFPVAWVPYELESFSSEHPELVTARKLVPALRALYARGLAKPYPMLGAWACVMTAAGMKAFEEVTGQPGLIDRAKHAWMQDMRACGDSEEAALESWLNTPGMRS